jgi:membrane protease subunit HflK
MTDAPQPPEHDQHRHRTLNVPDAPLDSANQSLADALRASFSVLKGIMVVLIVLFMFSGFKCVEEHQGAAIIRFGRLQPEARGAGLSRAWPYPIDETLRVNVTAETLKFRDSHWLRVRDDEQGLSLNQINRQGGLHPKHDGSLLTGDRGLAHVRWSLVYRIEDLPLFVANVADDNDAKTRKLIQTLLECAAVRAAAGLTAAEITQTNTDALAKEVKRLINDELTRLETGIAVTTVEIPEATVPIQIRRAFANVTRAENNKTTKIREARQQRADMLNAAAGASYDLLLRKVEALDAAQARGDQDAVAALEEEIDNLLETQATGIAGAAIRRERASYTQVVQAMRGDVEEFEVLLEEYQRTPRLLIDRLWQDTERRILGSPGVTKWFVPPNVNEVRLPLAPDPRDKRRAEEAKYKQEEDATLEEPGLEEDLGVPEGPKTDRRRRLMGGS